MKPEQIPGPREKTPAVQGGEKRPDQEQVIDVGELMKQPEYARAVAARKQEQNYIPLRGTMEMLGVNPEDALKKNQVEGPTYREIAGQYLAAAAERVSSLKGRIGGFINNAGHKLVSFGLEMQGGTLGERRENQTGKETGEKPSTNVRFFSKAQIDVALGRTNPQRPEVAAAGQQGERMGGPAEKVRGRYGEVVDAGMAQYAALMQRADGAQTALQTAAELARRGQERKAREMGKAEAHREYGKRLLDMMMARARLAEVKLRLRQLEGAAA